MNSKRLAWNATKALIKGIIAVAILVMVSKFMSSLNEVLPNYGLAFDVFALIFILLIVISEFLSGTIFQHVFNIFNVLFLMWYLLCMFSASVITLHMENTVFMIDLRIILSIAILLNLIRFAKTLLQLVNYLAENVEMEEKLQNV